MSMLRYLREEQFYILATLIHPFLINCMYMMYYFISGQVHHIFTKIDIC